MAVKFLTFRKAFISEVTNDCLSVEDGAYSLMESGEV
jgi:hypothetical protein